MTTVFLKVISGILRQHEELLRKYNQKALKLKEYDGIFLNARTTGGRTYFTGHRPGQKPKYIGNKKQTTVQRIQNLRATKVLISMLESNISALKHFQDNYIDITTEEIRKRLPKSALFPPSTERWCAAGLKRLSTTTWSVPDCL